MFSLCCVLFLASVMLAEQFGQNEANFEKDLKNKELEKILEKMK